MYIKINPIDETEKAYQLTESCWIPKSVLDGQGLEKPYYQIQNWWIESIVEKLKTGDKTAGKQLRDIVELFISHQDLPEDVKQIWQKYWGSYSEPNNDEIDPHDRRQEIGEWELGVYD